jgi:DNA ligase-1
MPTVAKLKKCFQVFEKIEATSKRNEKIEILSQNDDEDLKKILLYTFDKSLVYGIGERSIGNYKPKNQGPVKKRSLFDAKSNSEDLFVLCDNLASGKLSGNSAIQSVQQFLMQDDEFFFVWASKIFLKDLKMGMSSKTINDIFKDLIPVFDVQKAEVWDGEPINRPCRVQRKMNGYRCIIKHHKDGLVEIYSSNGVLLPGFEFIKDQVRTYLPADVAYDGELANEHDKFSRAQELVFSEQGIDKTEMKFYNWDWMSLGEWENQKTFGSYFFRHKTLSTIHKRFKAPNIELLDNVFEWNGEEDVDPTEEIMKKFDYALAEGWEGLMVKYDIPYVWDRTSDMVKIKKMKEADLVVTGVFEGKGNLKGKLGGVYVDYKGYKVGVGSGFKLYTKDAITGEKLPGERINFWEDPNQIIDKVIIVQYYEEMKDRNGNLSLQFPVFKGIHPEKNDQLF